MLLDLTAAFDTVDHTTLIARLEQFVGLKGTVLDWFRSYLSERSFKIKIGDCVSSCTPLPWGVPQGSILGPVPFSLYLLPLGQIFKKHNISYHLYADNTQIYLPVKRGDGSSATCLLDCLSDIKAWMAQSFLNFNKTKTEIIIFDPMGTYDAPLKDPHLPYFKPTVLNLGVKLDNDFKLDQQINSVVKTSFYHLRLLSKIKSVLSFSDFERVIHAFISTCLDYCSALYIGVNKASLARLQLVQNAAARLLTGTRKHDHITPILASLHWLPVQFRINFKILLFVF